MSGPHGLDPSHSQHDVWKTPVWIHRRYSRRAEYKKQDLGRQTWRMQRAERKYGRRKKDMGEGGRRISGRRTTRKKNLLAS